MTKAQSNSVSIWNRRPLIGLYALLAGLLGQWFRHTAFPLSQAWFGDYYYWGLLAIGFVGVAIVWRGLDESDIPATWKGYIGGLLIWIGWFEFSFHYFAEIFNVPPFQATARLVSPPDLNLVQASFPIFIAIFVVYGLFNRQTKCNMMRWIHRNLRINPGMPTANNNRSVSRTVALETIFVIWFCYAIWLFITYFGGSMRFMLVSYILWAAWFVYICYRLFKLPRAGYAFRYGIPVGIVGSVLFILPAHMRVYPEIWLKPFEYPFSSLAALGIFVAAIVLFARQPVTSRAAANQTSA